MKAGKTRCGFYTGLMRGFLWLASLLAVAQGACSCALLDSGHEEFTSKLEDGGEAVYDGYKDPADKIVRDGVYRVYSPDGDIVRKEYFAHGVPCGKSRGWDKSGRKEYEFSYNDKGQPDGKEVYWDRFGDKRERVFKDGKPWDGTFHALNEDTGNIVLMFYKEGRLTKTSSPSAKNIRLLHGCPDDSD